jgi:hypothetical protein
VGRRSDLGLIYEPARATLPGTAIRSITRRGILSRHWDQGAVVGEFRGRRGSFRADQP